MAFAGETMAAKSMRNEVSATLTQGVSLKSAMLFLLTMGLPKSNTKIPLKLKNWRPDFGWGQASGEGYDVKVLYNRGTATQRAKGGLRERTFTEKNIVDTATFNYFTIEQTYGVNEDDIRLNRNAKTRLVNIRKQEMVMAEAAVHAQLINVPWYATETGAHNVGLTVMSPTAKGASTTVGTIAMDATDDDSFEYWAPAAYDYGGDTIAADMLSIAEGAIDATEVSQSAGGLGIVRPDFAVMDPLAWAKFVQFWQDNLHININSGTAPRNLNMYEAGITNVDLDNVIHIKDHQFGGSTGYCDNAAVEEILYGNSKAIKLVTVNTKAEGLIRSVPVIKNSPLVTGELGVFKVDPFALVITDPKKFGLAHT